MENLKTNVLKQTMTYSAIIGLVLIVIMALQSFTLANKIPGFDFLFFFALLGGIGFSMRKISIGLEVEYLSFGKLTGIGFQLFAFTSVWIILYKIMEARISVDTLNTYINFMISEIELTKISDIQKAAQVEVIKTYPALIYIGSLIMNNLLMSTPIILLFGYYFKKGTKPTQTI